tara:strand:- start:960 stop:1109 length:150 start_codon:yes stop_codon:yes gene_type:complete
MDKKRYEGVIKNVSGFEIYLNINHLQKGNYVLKILNKNKIIKKTTFKKQ